jgi:site-specific DNA-cytosine methylase
LAKLNAKYFGVPQNRNRAYMVSIMKGNDVTDKLETYKKDFDIR